MMRNRRAANLLFLEIKYSAITKLHICEPLFEAG